MTRPIDADALLDFLDVGHLRPPTEICFSELMMKNIIDIQPTIDVVPVIHGKWIPCMMDSRGCTAMFKCSECKRYSYYAYGVKRLDYKYCPHCGARMDAERKEQ